MNQLQIEPLVTSTSTSTSTSSSTSQSDSSHTNQLFPLPILNNGSEIEIIHMDVKSLEDSRWWRACLAGSIAGLTEHSLLYPIDTVKTRLQSVLNTPNKTYQGFIDTFLQITRHEGHRALFRGLPAVLCAAVPSHAAYFGTYEYCKYVFSITHEHRPMYIIVCGAFATMAHDLIVTPFDVIKQRMQLKNCPYPNICKCAIDTFSKEGYLSFFRSYPATVLLNIPIFSANFLTYETIKLMLSSHRKDEEKIWHHLIAGGTAGAVAGLVSNPLDVIKTSIQTDKTKGYKSIISTYNKLISHDNKLGWKILLSGVYARVLYLIPSAAITWTTYETVKNFLGFPIHDLELH